MFLVSTKSLNLHLFALSCYIMFMDYEDTETYYTVKEFAKLLKVSPETIRRGIRSGNIIAVRIGEGKTSSLRIPRVQLDRMIYKNKEVL